MADKPSEIAGKAMGKAKAAVSSLKGASGIMKTLAEEHGEVSMLLKRGKAATDADSRMAILEEIREKLLPHAHCEEQEFYQPLQAHPETDDMVPHMADEHQQVEATIETLKASDASTQRWKDLFSQLSDLVTDHVKREENELFPKASDALSDDELERMNESYLRAKQSYTV